MYQIYNWRNPWNYLNEVFVVLLVVSTFDRGRHRSGEVRALR